MENQTPKTKARRAKNFSEAEIEMLSSEADKRRGQLFGPLKGPSLTQYHRDRAWEKVQLAVNSVAPAARTVPELKKKFKDLKGRAKSKASAFKKEARKTGGGSNEAVSLSAVDERMLTFIGKDSIEGIAGGIDTFRGTILNNPVLPVIPVPETPMQRKKLPTSTLSRRPPTPESFPSQSRSPVLSGNRSSPNPWSWPILSPPPPAPESDPASLDFQEILEVPEVFQNREVEDPASIEAERVVAPAVAGPSAPKKKRTNLKQGALIEIKRTAGLQEELNTVLKEVSTDLKDIKNQFKNFQNQFLQLKKRELDLMEENINLKKRRHI